MSSIRSILFLVVFCIVNLFVIAQSGFTVKGQTYYKVAKEPMPFVNVQLIDKKSGAVLNTTSSDLDGVFVFENIAEGSYQLKTWESTYGDSVFSINVNMNLNLKLVLLKKGCIYNRSINDKTCPVCHKKNNAIPIIYGLIVETDSKKAGKNFMSGGCQLTNCDPNWFCTRDSTRY